MNLPQTPSSRSSPQLLSQLDRPGIIVFAHGSRDVLWRVPIEKIASRIRELSPETSVVCAYLEICTPTLPDAAATLISAGVRHIKVFPVFLGVGKHAREDLPQLIEQVKNAHPDVAVALLPTIGENSQLLSLIAEIALLPVA